MKQELKVIAHIHTDFTAKFGIPRQSGLVNSVQGRILFEPEYRNPDAVRGLEEFSHIWLLWQFSKAVREGNGWSATVAPPRLGGRVRKGVFATRSPFRPNSIGLSSVQLDRIELDEKYGPVLYVSGADLLDGTPIYDIKPYLAYTDSHPEAKEGFAGDVLDYELDVEFPPELLEKLPVEYRNTVIELLRQDPRPGTMDAEDKEYRMYYGNYDIWFHVQENRVIVHHVVAP
jgi:tRNA-Thr(GGU) m(6)t(6)A37 methyltransferase TsaA